MTAETANTNLVDLLTANGAAKNCQYLRDKSDHSEDFDLGGIKSLEENAFFCSGKKSVSGKLDPTCAKCILYNKTIYLG